MASRAQVLVTPSTALWQTGVRPGGQDTEQPGHFAVLAMLHAPPPGGARLAPGGAAVRSASTPEIATGESRRPCALVLRKHCAV